MMMKVMTNDDDSDTTRGGRDHSAEHGLGFKPSPLLPVEMSNDETNNRKSMQNDSSIDT